MRRWLAAAVVVLMLAGMAAAEPKQVDSDWRRSDGVPAEIATPEDAPPEDAKEQAEEAAANIDITRVLLAAMCLIGLAAAGLWRWRTRR